MIMPQLSDVLYSSPNGDRWLFSRDPASGRMVVRHEPNLPSGGHVSETDVETFLSRGGSGPEYAALRKLLGESGEDR
jgi:hypothetical protein